MSTKTYRIASIPGDGIGIEVVAAAIEVLKTVAKKNNFELNITNFPWGTAFYKETGS
jgi:isocitrate/isopropylmalate dehydrogenase